jgi:4-methylaminobutanoate oxidase (formaldehyde-forming)
LSEIISSARKPIAQAKPVGYTTSGSYGHTVGAAIAMGYVNDPNGVNDEFIHSGRYEINVSGQRFGAKVYLHAPYDPKRKRILA